MSDYSVLGALVLCLSAGFLLRHFKKLPPQASKTLNAFAIQVAIPSLVFLKIHELFSQGGIRSLSWIPVSMAWIQFSLVCLVTFIVVKELGWNRSTMGAVILTAGLGNTSFVGFPLLEAIYGPQALQIAILADQPGSFLVFSTLGVTVAAFLGDQGKSHPLALIKKVIVFPPMIAFLFAIILSRWSLPEGLISALEKISASLIPVALVSVGYQIRISPKALGEKRAPLLYGLFMKLLLAPAFMTWLYFEWVGDRSFISQVTIAESAMAPMITGAILAEDSGFDSDIANLMVGVGIPVSLITVPLWAWFLQYLTA